ncbi:MAG: glycosyltransferase [Pedobacter sp.]
MKKKTIVISGANLFSGGTLSIMQDCLSYADATLSNEYKVIALIHDPKDFKNIRNVELIVIPDIRNSYFHRLYYEYFYYKSFSNKIMPFLWLSLNDISSNVNANVRAVYCHNATPFKKIVLSDLVYQPPVFFFTLFYKFLYSINIRKNRYVIVQQNWMKTKFKKMFGLDFLNIIVAPPQISNLSIVKSEGQVKKQIINFFYPTLPRPFKNIQVICKAVSLLQSQGYSNFNVTITIDGSENKYAKDIHRTYQHLNAIKFIGKISREEVYSYYSECDCLIFPSTLESWGLPISEFKQFNKPIILAELEYAHETLGNYDFGLFFKPDDEVSLANYMKDIILQTATFTSHKSVQIEEPFAKDWSALFKLLLQPK